MNRINTYFHRQENAKPNRCLNKCSISIIISEMLIRAIMRWHVTLLEYGLLEKETAVLVRSSHALWGEGHSAGEFGSIWQDYTPTMQ